MAATGNRGLLIEGYAILSRLLSLWQAGLRTPRRHKMKAGVVCIPLFLILTFQATSAGSTDKQVKDLIRRYEQVEAQLDRSVHYLKKEVTGDETTITQAWFNGAGDLIKVATEHISPAGRELTEYFENDFENNEEPMFMLVREETRLPDGGTHVDESRRYFGSKDHTNAVLILELRKSARFKAGELTDTIHVPNVVVDLAKEPEYNRSGEPYNTQEAVKETSPPLVIAQALREAGPPDADPFARVKGDSEKFRIIQETASPDGRYAMALGFARERVNWNDFVDQANTRIYKAEGEEDLRNYVVDLVQQRILGETGCDYGSTYPSSGRNGCQVVWSPDSSKFAYHQWSGKWWDHLVAGQIAPGPKLLGVVDLGKEIEKKTFSFLKKRPDSAALWLDIDQVDNEGVIQIRVDCVVRRSEEREGETLPSLAERLRLHATPAGLRPEMLSIRRVPIEQ